MPNTENTILESWPKATANDRRNRPLCHFALKQVGVNLDFHLQQYYRDRNLYLHFFEDFRSLVRICQRYPVDVIMVASSGDMMRDIEMLQAIKRNVFLSIIPVILYHPDPDYNDIVAAYESGVEDFIYGEWRERLVQVRIGRVIDRNRRDLAVNPSTHLPGPAIIEREIGRLLDLRADFAVAYADLDNFKAFNDYYGYYRGDKVIQLTSRIVKDVVFDLCPEGFVGHIAGDDFIFIMPRELVDRACAEVIKAFDVLIPYQYDEVDREHGAIETFDRRGDLERFAILTISIAVLVNRNGEFSHVGEMSKMLADLKKATKLKEGSNYMLERRRKY